MRDISPASPAARFREIKVLCLADVSYRRRFPEWKERIGEVVARASRDFEAVFAMRFAVVRLPGVGLRGQERGRPRNR